MEGRGASNRAENVIRERRASNPTETRDKIHYVHEILAQELIKRLLPDGQIDWEKLSNKENLKLNK